MRDFPTPLQVTLAEVARHSESIILTGSRAHSATKFIRKDSDFDFIVITSKPYDVAKKLGIPLDKYAYATTQFDCFATRELFICGEHKLGIHVLLSERFLDVCRMRDEFIIFARPMGLKTEYHFKSFSGRSTSISAKVLRVDDCCFTEVPSGLAIDGDYFVGAVRDMLLSNPEVLYDQNGRASVGIRENWNSILTLLDQNNAGEDPTACVLRALHRSDRFSEATILHICKNLNSMRPDVV